MERKQLLTTIAGLLVLALFIGGGFWLKNKQESGPVAEEEPQVMQSEVKLVVKSIKEKGTEWSIDVEYPQFEGVAPIFNQSIEKVVTDAIVDHKAIAHSNLEARMEFGLVPENNPTAARQFPLYIKWEQSQVNADYVSFVMRIGGYTGGAHGYENIVTFNYDIKNQKMLTLADMFVGNSNYLKLLSDYSRGQLDQSLGDYAYPEMINPGTEPNETNFKNFTFTDDVITIYFTQYQVAPYVAGEQQVNYWRKVQ